MVVAVVGTGSIGLRHLAVLREIGQEPVAVTARAARRRELSDLGYPAVGDLREAHDAGATAAVVASDTGRHAADVARAFDLGMSVLCEKPLTPAWAPAHGLCARAKSEGLSLFVGYCLRFDAGLQSFRSHLARVGAIHSVRIECRSFLPDWRPSRDYRETYSARREDGGVVRDLSHEVDYGLWLFGEAVSIRGELENLGRLGIASEERAEAAWQTAAGVSVSVGLDYLTRTPVRFVRASGSEGELAYDLVTGRLSLRLAGAAPVEESFERGRDALYECQARTWVGAVGGGPAELLATGVEAARVVAVCDAWRRSASTGSMERVEA